MRTGGRPRNINSDGTKNCSVCGFAKPLSEFTQRSDAPTTLAHCRPCNVERVRQWRAKNPQKAKESRAKSNRQYRFKRFGITEKEFNEQLER